MHVGRCCHCGPPAALINFKAFDADDGDLLWQDNFRKVLIATDDQIFNFDSTMRIGFLVNNAVVRSAYHAVSHMQDHRTAAVFDIHEWHVDEYSPLGVLAQTSPTYNLAIFPPTFPLSGLQGDTRYDKINSSGEMLSQQKIVRIEIFVIPNGITTDYMMPAYPLPDDFKYRWVTDNDVTVEYDVTDNVATIQAAFDAAFGSVANSVVVSAASASATPQTGVFTIKIDWKTDRYMKQHRTFGDSTISRSVYVQGNMKITSLVTGLVTSVASSGGITDQYFGKAIFTNSGKVFKEGTDSATGYRRMEMWTPVAGIGATWTLNGVHNVWQDHQLRSQLPPRLIPHAVSDIASRGSYSYISYRRTAGYTFPLTTTSAINRYDNSMTFTAVGVSPGMVTSQWPRGLVVQDDGTDIAAMNSNYKSHPFITPGLVSGSSVDYVQPHASGVVRASNTGTVQKQISLKNRNEQQLVGFNANAIAFSQGVSADSSSVTQYDDAAGAQYTDDSISQQGTIEDSGVVDPGAGGADYKWTRHLYFVDSPVNMIELDGHEWKFVIQPQSGSAVSTAWFAESATFAAVNASLLTQFGTNTAGSQNVSIETRGSIPLSVVETGKAIHLSAEGIKMTAFGALDASDETALATPTAFRQANDPASNIATIEVWIKDGTFANNNGFGMVNWSDGSTRWARNFTPADRTQLAGDDTSNTAFVYLRDDKLFAFGREQTAEDIP